MDNESLESKTPEIIIREAILKLKKPALEELIRLLKIGSYEKITKPLINQIGEYKSVEIDGEKFFTQAFSTGKETAGILELAERYGHEVILEKLENMQKAIKD